MNKRIENFEIQKVAAVNHRELYEIYFKGIPDSFDINGVHMPGVEPVAQKAIYHLNQIINSPEGTEKDTLDLAKIYHQGMHNFEPNLNKAEDIYLNLANQRINEKTWYKVMEGLDDIHKIRTYEWLNLPLPEPEPEQDIPENGNCGPGTTLQDGICVVNSENENTDTNVKWGGPYQDKKTAPNLDPVVDYDYELIYMIILVTVGIIASITVAFFVRIRSKRK